ncbi:Fic family protein [Bifidobacterium sp. ESL0775]|uniref:Fic family protein n=1 Tax=Bifidobacterium sp. ESL0775 TaxID=2983230 RepID=UPI0023F90358|nr:Fic family protein [Bifidobacterium sp. ESL0775]WEV69853.1 Fic family protein [Bifidobacterium sp. ESL0775]
MTPAERASAVAFSYKNCELSGITPSDAMVEAANGYQRGTLGLADFVATPERQAHRMNRQDTKQHGETRLRDDRIFARSVRLIDCDWPAVGGLEELKIIHRALFVGAMPDAGMLRDDGHGSQNESSLTQGLPTKQKPLSNLYFPASLIETGAANIFSQLEDADHFFNLDRAAFIHALTGLYDELNTLHPFAYGNGMVLRIFISELTHEVGWDLNWGTVTLGNYREATESALHADTTRLERMFNAIIRPANPTRVFLISGWDQGPAH